VLEADASSSLEDCLPQVRKFSYKSNFVRYEQKYASALRTIQHN
jgi:hypothetical protein